MGVRRKAIIIGTLAVLLTAASGGQAPAIMDAVSSVRTIRRNFVDLKKTESLNSVERFVFSLVLSRAKKPAEAAANTYPPPPTGRT